MTGNLNCLHTAVVDTGAVLGSLEKNECPFCAVPLRLDRRCECCKWSWKPAQAESYLDVVQDLLRINRELSSL